MHGSIWRFIGDPDELFRSYEAMLEEINPARMQLHLCLRTVDGLILVDTCPSKEVFDSFFAGEGFRDLRRRHGLPDPVAVEDYPVGLAIVDGGTLSL